MITAAVPFTLFLSLGVADMHSLVLCFFMMMMIITMIIISAVLYSTFVRKGLLECVCVFSAAFWSGQIEFTWSLLCLF